MIWEGYQMLRAFCYLVIFFGKKAVLFRHWVIGLFRIEARFSVFGFRP